MNYSRRDFLKAAGFSAAAVCSGCAGQLIGAGANKKKPNVLFIAIDDLRPELGCYGNKHIQSPHIDTLAMRGIVFERAYCQVPVCGPSRASLLTGMYPGGSRFNTWKVEDTVPDALTLPGTFRGAGYHTISNGKIFHHPNDTAEQSWSEPPFNLVNGAQDNNHLTFHDKDSANYIGGKRNRGPFFEAPDVPDNTYIDGQTCDKTVKDMRRLATMNKPFFLACGFVRPHLPFYAPKKYWDMYKREDIALAENRFKPKNAPASLKGSGEVHSYHNRNIKYNSPEFHKTARHGYYACVSYADALVGKLLATLDELGFGDNTIVVIWGDHGWHLGEHNFWSKHNLLHNATNSPLIISAPGFKKNCRTDGIVEFVDIYPTLCSLTGIELPKQLEGTSMVPLMRDPKRPWKKAAFTRFGNGATVTTRDYTYTEYGNKAERMLYDRKKDPAENENVAAVPEYHETVKELSKLLAEGWENAKPEK